MAYGAFAGVYDALNEDADYDALASFIGGILREHDIRDGIVVDLGCGTGELTLRLDAVGYDMIGVDQSPEMLSILREKMGESGQNGLLLLCQSIETLDLYGTVRAAVSTFDTFNHIGGLDRFQQALSRAALFLEPGGVFLFDMNTPYKHREVLRDQTYEIEADDAYCVWHNRLDEQAGCTHITLKITYPDIEECDTEAFDEYFYTWEEIYAACVRAGLSVERVVDGESFDALRPDSLRYMVVAVKEPIQGADSSCQN